MREEHAVAIIQKHVNTQCPVPNTPRLCLESIRRYKEMRRAMRRLIRGTMTSVDVLKIVCG